MKIFQLYIARNLFAGWGLAFAIATAVFGLLFLLAEMERLGDSYQFGDAALYVLLTLPQRMFSLLPVVILLGSMLVLINMESANELTVMGASGISSARLLQLMCVPLLVLMCCIWLATEFITPRLNGLGEDHKLMTYGRIERHLDQAAWSRLDNGFVHLGRVDHQGISHKIELFLFNEEGRLSRSIYADSGEVLQDRLWQLRDVVIKDMQDKNIETSRVDTLEVDNLWQVQELPMLKLSSDSMPLSMLYEYSRFQKDNRQRSTRYEFAFWKLVTLPLNCAAMMFVAVPMAGRPGYSRNVSMGIKLGVGCLIGICFYLGSQIAYALGEILRWPSAFACLLPVMLIVLCAVVLLRRRQW